MDEVALHLLNPNKEFLLANQSTPRQEILSAIKKENLVPLYMHMLEVQKAYKHFQSFGLTYDYQLHAHYQARGVSDRINQICKWIEKYNIEGIIYPDYNLTGTETGRVTSRGFPFANLDNKEEIRLIFKARKDHTFLYLDYSQAEMTIAGCLFNCSKFNQLLTQDIYQYFSNLWGLNNRDLAKQCFILSVYGGGAKAFARVIDCSEQEAFMAQSLLFHEFPEIRDWIGHVRYQGSTHAFITNSFGRRRPTQNLKPQALINFPIQSALADIKMAVIRDLYESNLTQYLRLDFHDGLVFEIPNQSFKEIAPILQAKMSNPSHGKYLSSELNHLHSLKCTAQISTSLHFK